MKTVAFLSTLCAIMLTASLSFACGGLFCSQTVTAPAPVDQTAERIIFTVNPETETTTAEVSIQYTGSADQFAWIVPVAGTPVVEDGSVSRFDELQAISQAQVMFPSPPVCPGATRPSPGGFAEDSGGGGCGCGADDSGSVAFDNFGNNSNNVNNVNNVDPVTVLDQNVTDNYEWVVITAEMASDLVDWLQDNEYNVSPNMIPVMQPYVDEGLNFLALKLRDGKTANDIVPIQFEYEGTEPMIPLRLTAVTAQPYMGILVFILGQETYSPAGSFAFTEPDTEELLFDANENVNYFDWMARVSDESGGRTFVREFSGPYGEYWMTRFYTRMSPKHMTADPTFEPAIQSMSQDPFIDLSARVPVECNDFETPNNVPVPERQPSPCAFNYCGEGATCVVHNDLAHCLCGDDQVAQRVTGPTGDIRVACEPRDNPFGVTAEAGGAGTEFDPCNDYNCGEGTCVLKGGFPTCLCSAGTGACLVNNLVECASIPGDAPSFGPGAGLESQGSTEPLEEPSNAGGGVLLALLATWMFFIRRRFTG